MFFSSNGIFGEFFSFTLVSDVVETINQLPIANFEDIKVFINSYSDKYVIEGIFPGIDKRDIIINYKDDYINIKVSGDNYITAYEDMFKEVFYVPGVDVSNMKISYENEILHFELPKLLLQQEEVEIIDVYDYENE